MTMQRQGDFIFVATDLRPAPGRLMGKGVVSRSPLTGHSHAFTDPGLKMYSLPGVTGEGRDMMALTETPVQVIHEEHGALDLPGGMYFIRRQIERSSDGIREVVD